MAGDVAAGVTGEYRALLASLYDGALDTLEVIRRKELFQRHYHSITHMARISRTLGSPVPRRS